MSITAPPIWQWSWHCLPSEKRSSSGLCGAGAPPAAFALDFIGAEQKSKINFKGGGRGRPPHTTQSESFHAGWNLNIGRPREWTVVHLNTDSAVPIKQSDPQRQAGVLGHEQMHRALGLLVVVGIKLVP